MNCSNITVNGSGVLESQIAYKAAFIGFNVSVYDINDEALECAKERIVNLKPRYQEDLGAESEAVNSAYERISFSNAISFYKKKELS